MHPKLRLSMTAAYRVPLARRACVVAALLMGVWAGVGANVSAAKGPDSTRTDTAGVVKSPGGAMLRSLAVPGWGQFYNRKHIKGGLVAAAEIGSVVAFLVRRDEIRRDTPPGIAHERNEYLFTTLGLILFSMGDAYVDAHLDAVDWGEIEVGATERGMELRVRVRW